MLQPCPMDDAVRLLKPILSAETWVSNTLQLRLVGSHDKKLQSPLCSSASQQFGTSSDLLPSDSGSALSCPAC